MAIESSGVISYRVSGLPAGSFGETYVITTGTLGANGTHSFEYFVLSRRHEPHLYHEDFPIEPGDVPDELLTVDESSLLVEARQQAQLYLDDALYKLADLHGDHVLNRYNAELLQLGHMPLLGLWMKGELHDEIRTTAQETASPRLRLILSLVTQSKQMRRG